MNNPCQPGGQIGLKAPGAAHGFPHHKTWHGRHMVKGHHTKTHQSPSQGSMVTSKPAPSASPSSFTCQRIPGGLTTNLAPLMLKRVTNTAGAIIPKAAVVGRLTRAMTAVGGLASVTAIGVAGIRSEAAESVYEQSAESFIPIIYSQQSRPLIYAQQKSSSITLSYAEPRYMVSSDTDPPINVPEPSSILVFLVSLLGTTLLKYWKN